MSPVTPPRSPTRVSKSVRSAKRKASLRANARRTRSQAQARVNTLYIEIPKLMVKSATANRENNQIRYATMLMKAQINLAKAHKQTQKRAASRRAARSGSRGE